MKTIILTLLLTSPGECVGGIMINVDNNLNNKNRFFDGQKAALQCITSALTPADQVRIAAAYFEGSGFQALQNVLIGKKIKLLIGRQEGGEDCLREVLQEFINELSYGPMENRTRSMRQMLEALEQGQMTVSVGASLPQDTPIMDARYIYPHAKLYIADKTTAVVTSANFSFTQKSGGRGICFHAQWSF